MNVRTLGALAVAALLITACRPVTPQPTLSAAAPTVTTPATACRQRPLVQPATAVRPEITWIRPESGRDGLDRWCAGVGAPLIISSRTEASPRTFNELAVVSWNVHVGLADIAGLVAELRAGALTGGRPMAHFALLLQETHRAGDAVPDTLPRGAKVPRAQGLHQARRNDIAAVATSLGLWLYYVPAMRNGEPGETDEDRGNAILSTESLTEFRAVELPFERQRRVAVGATVEGRNADGSTWRLPLVNAHLDHAASNRHLWLFMNGPRGRQARALLDSTAGSAPDPVLLAGDFNTWLGYRDPTYRLLAAAVPDVSRDDRRPTFLGRFRLDHVFARPPAGWSAEAQRPRSRFGSDHNPLVVRLHR